MGKFATVAMKAAGIGWPNVGWQPPYGWSGDTIAATVNQNTAMGVGAFTAGIRLIAEDIASHRLSEEAARRDYGYDPAGARS